MIKKVIGILFLSLMSVGLFSCEKDDEPKAKDLSLVGETSKNVSRDAEVGFAVNIRGKNYSLFAIDFNAETISTQVLTDFAETAPEIVLIGEFESLDLIPEKRYTGYSGEFSNQAEIVNNGGYLIKMRSVHPYTGETVQWVVKMIVRYREGGFDINYALYSTTMGSALAKPVDPLPNYPSGDGGDASLITGGGDEVDDNREDFTFQGEGSGIKIPMDYLEKIKSANGSLLFNLVNSYPTVKVVPQGNTLSVGIVYLGSNTNLDKINYKLYSLPALSYYSGETIKSGSYLVRMTLFDGGGGTTWIAPMVIKDNSNHTLSVSYRIYSVD